MHQAYFERKSSQPSTTATSRSLTPKPFSRMQEDPTKSPERLHSEYGQINNHSPTVTSQRTLTSTSQIFGSSSKASSKSKEQVLHTDRQRSSRNPPAYYYNVKNTNNISTDLMRGKPRPQAAITKTEPSSGDLEGNYTGQINKLLQKVNKLKYDLSQLQERETIYMSKLSNLENENKSLQLVIEDKDKKLQEITHKSKEDKLRMYQFLTELESYKKNNAEQQQFRDDVSPATTAATVRFSDYCDSSRKVEKSIGLDKGIQATEGADIVPTCARCENVNNYCEVLITKLTEADQASRQLLKEHTAMKESLMKARRAETDYMRARCEIEKRATEIKNDFDKQAEVYNEIVAENYAIRTTLKEAMNFDSTKSQGGLDVRKSLQAMKMNKENVQQSSMYPLPSSLRALIGAEKISKTAF